MLVNTMPLYMNVIKLKWVIFALVVYQNDVSLWRERFWNRFSLHKRMSTTMLICPNQWVTMGQINRVPVKSDNPSIISVSYPGINSDTISGHSLLVCKWRTNSETLGSLIRSWIYIVEEWKMEII